MTHFLGQSVTEDNLNNQEYNEDIQQNHGEYVSRIAQERNQELNNALNDAEKNDKEDSIMDKEEGKKLSEWINASKIRRYKAVIAAENVQGDTHVKKINLVNDKINGIDDFMGSKIIYMHNKLHICEVFGKKISMEKTCKVSLFEDNDFHLEPIQNRGDEEVRDKTVVIRDLPLDVDRLTLKKIMEKVGTVTDIKLQISGMWYKAYVTYDNKSTVENQFKDKWSVFYLKDLCRVAPATVAKQEIEERNRNTLKLAGLPFGTTAYDLRKVLHKTGAKTCFIPRTRNQYERARYTYVTFDNEDICTKLLNNELVVTINETILR